MKKEISYLETLTLISEVKAIFEKELEEKLDLIKVPCPLFVKTSSGLQDGLTGIEESVGFIKSNEHFEIVHSLAKWKREALSKYEFPTYKGLYTDMKAIRKDEIVDDIHSLYVEQYDWEKIISKSDRSIKYLKEIVKLIYEAIKKTAAELQIKNSYYSICLPESVYFITSQKLEDLYPTKSAKERERLITKKHKVVFIIGIGEKLKSGIKHDLRSPDYDDWQLNGDLLIFDETLDKEIEISSMGIRVDKKSLIKQLTKSSKMDRIELPYHQKIIKKELPNTIGGGIGSSRLIMILLRKKHIAEVQASSWEEKTLIELKELKIL